MNKLHLVWRVRIRHQAASDQIRIEYQSNQMIRFDWLECDRRTLWSQIYYIFRNVFKYLLKWWRYLQNLIFAKQALIWIMSRSGEWLKIGIGNQILRLRHWHKIYNFLADQHSQLTSQAQALEVWGCYKGKLLQSWRGLKHLHNSYSTN